MKEVSRASDGSSPLNASSKEKPPLLRVDEVLAFRLGAALAVPLEAPNASSKDIPFPASAEWDGAGVGKIG